MSEGDSAARKKEELQKSLEIGIATATDRVAAAEAKNDEALAALDSAGGVLKAPEDLDKNYYRFNMILLAEVESLRLQEKRLRQI